MTESIFFCPVCGWKGLQKKPVYPYGTFEICSCCGTQYGLDVTCEEDILEVRADWLKEGASWFSDFDMPNDWSTQRALEQIEEFLAHERDGL